MLVWYAAWRVRPGVKFFDYALLGDDNVIADPVVVKSYLEVMEECEVTISKEKSVPNVSALEFAKRFMVYKVTLDFSPVSLRVLRTLSSGVSTFLFSELRVNLLCSYRLRGGSYKVYSRQGLPTSKRWKRHYLLMFSPTGRLPLPLKFWLAFPNLGVLTAEQYGMVRAFIMERVRPSNFNEVEIDRIRTFYGDDADCMFERFLKDGWSIISDICIGMLLHGWTTRATALLQA